MKLIENYFKQTNNLEFLSYLMEKYIEDESNNELSSLLSDKFKNSVCKKDDSGEYLLQVLIDQSVELDDSTIPVSEIDSMDIVKKAKDKIDKSAVSSLDYNISNILDTLKLDILSKEFGENVKISYQISLSQRRKDQEDYEISAGAIGSPISGICQVENLLTSIVDSINLFYKNAVSYTIDSAVEQSNSEGKTNILILGLVPSEATKPALNAIVNIVPSFNVNKGMSELGSFSTFLELSNRLTKVAEEFSSESDKTISNKILNLKSRVDNMSEFYLTLSDMNPNSFFRFSNSIKSLAYSCSFFDIPVMFEKSTGLKWEELFNKSIQETRSMFVDDIVSVLKNGCLPNLYNSLSQEIIKYKDSFETLGELDPLNYQSKDSIGKTKAELDNVPRKETSELQVLLTQETLFSKILFSLYGLDLLNYVFNYLKDNSSEIGDTVVYEYSQDYKTSSFNKIKEDFKNNIINYFK